MFALINDKQEKYLALFYSVAFLSMLVSFPVKSFLACDDPSKISGFVFNFQPKGSKNTGNVRFNLKLNNNAIDETDFIYYGYKTKNINELKISYTAIERFFDINFNVNEATDILDKGVVDTGILLLLNKDTDNPITFEKLKKLEIAVQGERHIASFPYDCTCRAVPNQFIDVNDENWFIELDMTIQEAIAVNIEQDKVFDNNFAVELYSGLQILKHFENEKKATACYSKYQGHVYQANNGMMYGKLETIKGIDVVSLTLKIKDYSDQYSLKIPLQTIKEKGDEVDLERYLIGLADNFPLLRDSRLGSHDYADLVAGDQNSSLDENDNPFKNTELLPPRGSYKSPKAFLQKYLALPSKPNVVIRIYGE